MWDSANNPTVTALGPNGAQINGYCTAAFRPVFDAFVANFVDVPGGGVSLLSLAARQGA
jgi:hypothetical protein